MDGNRKKTDDAHRFMKSEYGTPLYPEFPGYDDERYFRNIVNETGDRLRVRDIKY